MPRIKIEVCIRAPLQLVWEMVADIRTHTEWMVDAESITVTSDCSSGVGTTFDCVTKIGPFRTIDHMEITEWIEERVMGVAHRGLVSGSGRFTLQEAGPSDTNFSWEETLTFPWWIGGRLTSIGSTPVLKAIWRGNLRRLSRLVEDRHRF
ncbi:MAG: SRPBCC family protein [Acidimicrobiales bacterium]|nr:SRPBCC family protein [Acidimicrobiaceae bacterium]MBT5206481.1 SRPBCC family protein [Acidimicrobiaceae bacterium]MDE0834302.1 SRPBCC family protein [Acidimicrobiales bacterium]